MLRNFMSLTLLIVLPQDLGARRLGLDRQSRRDRWPSFAKVGSWVGIAPPPWPCRRSPCCCETWLPPRPESGATERFGRVSFCCHDGISTSPATTNSRATEREWSVSGF